jgi:hypothetical protein
MMLDRGELDRAYEARRRQVRRLLIAAGIFYAALLVLMAWCAVIFVKAGPEGIGREIGQLVKGIREGAK